jgi:hypothetical protein
MQHATPNIHERALVVTIVLDTAPFSTMHQATRLRIPYRRTHARTWPGLHGLLDAQQCAAVLSGNVSVVTDELCVSGGARRSEIENVRASCCIVLLLVVYYVALSVQMGAEVDLNTAGKLRACECDCKPIIATPPAIPGSVPQTQAVQT